MRGFNPPTNPLRTYDKVMRSNPSAQGSMGSASGETCEEEVDTDQPDATTWTITEYDGEHYVTPWCISKLKDDLENANGTIRALKIHLSAAENH